MAEVTMKALLETGVHFGHRTRKWNPKMNPYIFTERNGIHILDLQQTLASTKEVFDLVRDIASEGGTVLFLGTKRQAQDTIASEAVRCGMPYVNERWLGGFLTNWRTISERIEYLEELEGRRDRGEFDLLTKKEALSLQRQIDKLNTRLGGIRNMDGLPKLLFVIDVRREYTAIREANILDIPIIAMVDTNCDPDPIDYVIPSNDDAIRAIKLITSMIADAVLEGRAMRKDELEDEGSDVALPETMDFTAMDVDSESDEEFLGEATLAKLEEMDVLTPEEEENTTEEETDDSEATEEETKEESEDTEESEE